MSVPKSMQEKYDEIASLLILYCDQYLNEEYKEILLFTLEKLCRKRPSPLLRGRAKTWAAGIVYAIGSNNFIFDSSMPIHYTAKELMAPFGLSNSTGANKAAEIKKMLKIDYGNVDYVVESLKIQNPLLWMVVVNGYMVDARKLPIELQEVCFEQGLIPFVPGTVE